LIQQADFGLILAIFAEAAQGARPGSRRLSG